MKKMILLAAGIACLAACTEKDLMEPKQASSVLTIEAVNAVATRSSLDADAKTVLWNVAEKIGVFYGNTPLGSFTSSNEAPASRATFSNDSAIATNVTTGETFYAVYPYEASATCSAGSITMPVNLKNQLGKANTFADKSFPSAGTSTTTSMVFKNICGGVKFKLSASDVRAVTFTAAESSAQIAADEITFGFTGDVPVVSAVNGGTHSITMTLPDGETFTPGTYYYMAALPAVLAGGFTMTFETGTKKGTRTCTNNVEIERSVFGDLGVADEGVSYIDSSIIDLSENGTANCYIVTAPGNYRFKTVQGNTDEPTEEVELAEVLWETFNTGVAPQEGDLIQDVQYADNYISFKFTGLLGNAVIAGKDASGTIVWSWHIWCSPVAANDMLQTYSFRQVGEWGTEATFMDRNLGAISGTPGEVGFLGLMYQWGRKDPFQGASSIEHESMAAISTVRPAAVVSSPTTGTIEYSIHNPMQYITMNANNGDWLWGEVGEGVYADTERWGGNHWGMPKSKYDPCPPGYKVPFSNGWGQWIFAMGTVTMTEPDLYDPETHCMDLTDVMNCETPVYIPFTGFMWGDRMGLLGTGRQTLLSSTASFFNNALYLDCRNNGYISAHTNNPKTNGCPVRCVKE